jgi:sugar/nucleoside kinase (ribokinase family)
VKTSHCIRLYVAFLIYFSFTIEYHPGGAAQNTLRIFQWLLGYPHYSVFFGAIGNDDEGKLLEKLVKNSGVETRYTMSRSSYPFFTIYKLEMLTTIILQFVVCRCETQHLKGII